MARLRAVRLTVRQLAIVAGCSALATGVIISSAASHKGVPSAVITAYQRRLAVQVVHSPTAAGSTTTTASSTTTAPTASSPLATVPSSPSPSPAAVPSTSGADTSGSSDASTGSSDSDSSSSSSSSSSSNSDDGNTGSGPTDSTSSGSSTSGTSTSTTAKTTYKVKHVFVIALSTTSYQAAFGHGSVAHYLNGTLRHKGTLLSGYQSLGSAELPQYVAMVSGQAPNADTNGGCSTYAEFSSAAKAAKNGQVRGSGCIYPNTALTIADQVTASGKRWGAYIDDMGSTSCMHPNSNAVDDTPPTGAGSDYDTRHNPFIYFHSLLDLGGCSSDDVDLGRLPSALRTAAKTPRYAFIAPGACDDAAVATCPDGTPGGLAGEDAFLKLWVPRILKSAAYKRNGVLIIAFASTPPASGGSQASGPVRTGALILSPYAKKGKTVAARYGPYSLLRSVEDLFGYTPLAQASKAKSFLAKALPSASGT